MAKKNLNFDEKMNRLEEIVILLDKGESPIEELLTLYEEGISLASDLRKFLDKAEQKVIDITQKNKIDANESNDNEK